VTRIRKRCVNFSDFLKFFSGNKVIKQKVNVVSRNGNRNFHSSVIYRWPGFPGPASNWPGNRKTTLKTGAFMVKTKRMSIFISIMFKVLMNNLNFLSWTTRTYRPVYKHNLAPSWNSGSTRGRIHLYQGQHPEQTVYFTTGFDCCHSDKGVKV